MNQQTVFPSGRIARWVDTELEGGSSSASSQESREPGEASASANEALVRERGGEGLRYRPFRALAPLMRG